MKKTFLLPLAGLIALLAVAAFQDSIGLRVNSSGVLLSPTNFFAANGATNWFALTNGGYASPALSYLPQPASANLTNWSQIPTNAIPASQLAGTVADARLSSNVVVIANAPTNGTLAVWNGTHWVHTNRVSLAVIDGAPAANGASFTNVSTVSFIVTNWANSATLGTTNLPLVTVDASAVGGDYTFTYKIYCTNFTAWSSATIDVTPAWTFNGQDYGNIFQDYLTPAGIADNWMYQRIPINADAGTDISLDLDLVDPTGCDAAGVIYIILTKR